MWLAWLLAGSIAIARGDAPYRDCVRVPLERITVLGTLAGLTGEPTTAMLIAGALPALLVIVTAIGMITQLR